MKTLLQLNTSLFSTSGQSTQLADNFVASWRADSPAARLIVRDLNRNPLPHLTAERFQSFLAKPAERMPAQQAIVAESDALIEELRRADVIVLATPMYNFSVPSTLKAYFDHIARAGVTFRYTEHGPVGMLSGKKAYVITTRGGIHAGTPGDTETAYVRQFLAFLGITDVEFIYAEGLALGDAAKAAGIAGAQRAIEHLQETAAIPLAA